MRRCYFVLGFFICAVPNVLAEEPRAGRLQLNIDFHDLVVAQPPFPDDATFLGCEDGVYPAEKLRALIQHAAGVGFDRIQFRIAVCGLAAMPSKVKEVADNHPNMIKTLAAYDPFRVAIDASHDAGIECFAWLTPLDDGPSERHMPNKAPLQSKFSQEHPEYQLLSRNGDDPICGVYCFGYDQVLRYYLAHLDEVLAYKPDGVFYSNRTHSNMKARQKEYGFNEPVIRRYQQLYHVDPREPEGYEVEKFSGVLGDFYTEFLRQSAERIHKADAKFAVATSWQRNGRIHARLGSLHKSFFQWQRWADEGIVDELVIGGDLCTGNDPEHILPNYEVNADSANPAYFRNHLKRRVPISRWLTLWDWGWNVGRDRTGPPASTFTTPVIRKMLDKTYTSGVDGVLIHEALNIAVHNQWEMYAAGAWNKGTQPRAAVPAGGE